jgi:hypothetical protein
VHACNVAPTAFNCKHAICRQISDLRFLIRW